MAGSRSPESREGSRVSRQESEGLQCFTPENSRYWELQLPAQLDFSPTIVRSCADSGKKRSSWNARGSRSGLSMPPRPTAVELADRT